MTDNTPVTTAEMLRRIQVGWDDLQAYLSTLTPEQLTQPSDAAGWTIKDHYRHLAVWEDGIEALISEQSRRERMGVDVETWDSDWHADDFFHINDVIFHQHKDKSLDTVLAEYQTIHQRFIKTVGSLSDADLMRPYKSFDASSGNETPIFQLIVGDSFGHYAEHRPWMQAIAQS